MRHNMGKIERVIRFILGVVLFMVGWRVLDALAVFGAAATTSSIVGVVLAVIGLINIVTGLLAYCPLYALLHFNTCEACRIGETHKHMPV